MSINSVSSQSAAQELRETAAQTRAEALKGDQQAIRKLARQQQTTEAAETSEPSGGDRDSDDGRINATA